MRNTSYRFLTLLCLLSLGISTLFAVPAYRGWRTMTQPDGSTITIRQMGDEFFHYWENEAGQQVEEDAQGYWHVLETPVVESQLQKKMRASRHYTQVKKSGQPAKVGGVNLAPRGLVILVNFSDVAYQSYNTKAAMSELMNSENYTYNSATGSVREFFKAQSNGQYVPDFDVVGPYTLANNRAHYGANSGAAGTDVLAGDMVIEACKAADADGVDFTKYNNDGDTYVDFVYVIYAGVGEADANPKVPNSIWPHNWTIASARYYGNCTYTASQCKVDGLTINNYACSGELTGNASNRCPIGTITHEFGHVLGLPDYYVTDEDASNEGKNYTPGAWHIMDYGSYNNSGRTPPNYTPHDKYFFGWATPTLLAKNEKKNCTLTTTYGSAYQINGGTTLKAATDESRVWYLENRQKSGWDTYLPGHGMVVWEVNYNSTDWSNNEPNNENVGYTVVTANSLTRPYTPCVYSTTASSTSGTTFPGTSNVTSYTPTSGCALTEITESGGNITFKYNGGQAKWSYALLGENCTYPSDGEVNFNASLSLTITPDAGYTLADAACWEVTMGSTTLTYGTDFTYNSSTNTFYIPSVTGDVEMYIYGGRPVTWMANGSEFTTNMSIGDKITLPATNPSDCSGTGGKKFVGWCTNSSYSHASTAPTFAKTGDAYTVATYYAVYATGTSGTPTPATLSASYNSHDGWTVSSGMCGSSYWVLCAGATLTSPTIADLSTVTSITLKVRTFGGSDYNTVNVTSGSTSVGSAVASNTTLTSKTISVSGLSGSGSLVFSGSATTASYGPGVNEITINYSTGGTSYSDYSTTCAACTLTSITLNTSGATTTFTQGQTFTSEGLVVTASYSDCSDRTVSPTSVSSPDMSSTGNKTVTVTYTEGEVTKTKTYTITVNAAPTYTIRFFDGTTKLKEESLVAGATATPPSDPADCTDNGYTFVGWYTSKLADDNTTVTSGWITDFTVSAAQDYYAVYSHTETSGSGSSATYEFSITTGDFSGSSYSANDGAHTSTAYDVTDNTNTMSVSWTSSNVSNQSGTQWKKNGSYIYNDTDLGKINSVTITGDALTKYYGTASNPSNSTLGANDGYFKVTNETSGALHTTSITVNFTISSGGGSSTTYYVGTKDCTTPTEVTITFHKNDGTDATTSQTIDYNTPTNLTANTFSREGYTFQGWATSASGEKVHNDQASVTLTKNTDLYAVWQKNSHNVSYTITPADKATATINSSATTPQSIDYGETVTLDITPNDAYVVSEVTATGVTLTGTGNSRTFTMPDNDVTISITLAAKPKYTVTWSANGTTTTEEYIEGASIVFPETATGCDGKVFVGWSASEVAETDTKPALVTSATMGTSPLTYYAVFAESSTGSGANKFRRITADDELVRASGTQIAIISNYAEKILQNDFTSVGAPTPDGEGLITVTDDQIWTLTTEESGYWTLISGSVQLGIEIETSHTSYYECGNYTTAASSWVIRHADDVSGTDDCFYLYNWHSSNWYDLLEFYGGSTQKWESVYFASTSASGFATYGAMRIYVPAASYTGYTTSCTPCDYKVTLTKGEEENGTFTLSKSNGTYNNCTSDFVVTVSGITPAEHYVCSGVTATGGNNTVTGPDGSGNYTVTYTKGNSITSTITANFTPESKYTVIWSQNGDNSNTAEYYEGEAIVFPSTASGCDGKVFRGWSADPVAETDDEPTYVTSATMPNHDVTYYAVFAEGSEGGGIPEEATITGSYGASTGWTISDVCTSTGSSPYWILCEGATITSPVIDDLSTVSSITYKTRTSGGSSYTTINVSTSGGASVGSTTATSNSMASKSISVSGLTGSGSLVFSSTTNSSSGGPGIQNIVITYTTGGSTSYSGYTTTCGAGINAKNIGWITAAKGQKVKREISVSAKNFDDPTTLSATCANSHFNVSLAATAVPSGATGLTTTLTVEYTPAEFNVREENVDIVLTAGGKTRTIKVSGRSLPEEFVIITKKSSTWYALPANMADGPSEYEGVEITPNNATTPTAVAVAPSTIVYKLFANNVSDRYATKGNCVRLVGNSDLCLWSNMSTSATKINIQNKTNAKTASGDNYDWELTTTDGIQYTIANPNHPHYGEGRRLAFGTKFGLYDTETVFFIVETGCSGLPDVNVSARRVDATFAWVSNASSMQIDIYSDEDQTALVKSETATSQPHVITDLTETTDYWYKLIPDGAEACSAIGHFKTSGPTIDVVEWEENTVVLFVDKDEAITPKVIINGEKEYGIGTGSEATNLFFSKYFEAEGTAKMLAVFNGTSNPISLADVEILHRSNSSNSPLSLASLGKVPGYIQPGEEIIMYNRDSRAAVMQCAESDPTFSSWNNMGGNANLAFGGKGTIRLFRGGKCIDIIGAMTSTAEAEDIHNIAKVPAEGSTTPSWGDDKGFVVATGDNYKTKNIEESDYGLSTNRCLLIRKSFVTSGDSAVMNNFGDFKTLGRYEGVDSKMHKSEWAGWQIPTAGSGETQFIHTCEGFQEVGQFDYSSYYKDYITIDDTKTLDDYIRNADEKTYAIPIDNLAQYSCLNLLFQLTQGDNVLTEAPVQVPIIVKGNVSTNSAIFNEIVKTDSETPVPLYDKSIERCKTCDVVVLGNAVLTKDDSGDEHDVPEVGNLKVYQGGQVVVPSGTTYTVNSLALRRQEEEALPIADIQGILAVKKDNSTFLDVRIDPTNWHYITLPYDCRVSDVTFADGTPAAVGADYLLCSYDGEHRAATKSTSWKDLTSEDVLRKGVGYIIALPGDGKVKREIRFPMSNDVLTENKADKDIGIFNGWGNDNPELRPNHKGWNLIGNPYFTYYKTNLTSPLATGKLIHDPDESPWKGHWTIDPDPETNLYYIVIPQDNGWSEYKQVAIANYHMAPYTSYFVQLGSDPSEDKTITFEHSRSGLYSAPKRYYAEDIVDNHEVWFGVDLINADGESDETTLLMSDKFTNDYDMMRDLVKMRGTYYTYYTKPVLASRNNEGEMAFNALPDSTAAAGVPLNFYAATAGQYRFTVSAHYPLDEVKEAYLYDNDNTDAKWHNLLQEDYVFDAKRGDNTTRFMLAVKVERKQPEITTSMDNLHKGLVLTTVNRTLMLSGLTNDAEIYVYDVSGKLLDARMHYSSASGIFRTTVNTSGLYFVRVKTPDGQQILETVVY